MADLDAGFELALLREDLAYHQARILLLVDAVCAAPGHARKLDGLTKLAKLDFLLRYPALAPQVLTNLRTADPRLHLSLEDQADPTDVESPMTRYKYGPWDDRYYSIIGALVGRGLLRYVRGRKGSVALATTTAGKHLARQMQASEQWSEIADRCHAVAEASSGLTGNALKEIIYGRLADLMDRPHRQVIR
ncbi:hypothetical protein C8054_28150 [Micromonospora sp. RP3T]|nr:hypothetical protein C8054_28150 [Micromonospora sp. RP3T]